MKNAKGQLLASTEPRSFERGDGAYREALGNAVMASTEPRSFERGDITKVSSPRCGLGLQRSRALSSAEMASSRAGACSPARLQRSRALSSAEICTEGGELFDVCKLQRSRALSSAEIQHRRCRRLRRSGFNGAALFRARRSGEGLRADLHARVLQRSRALSSAEMALDAGVGSAESCSFNGAALFRARR